MGFFNSLYRPKTSSFLYIPRYQKKKKGLENRKSSFKLEKGSFYKHSKTFSQFKGPSLTHYKHNTKKRKYAKYIVSLSMMACISYFYLKGGYAGLVALGGFLILLIVFLSLNNKS